MPGESIPDVEVTNDSTVIDWTADLDAEVTVPTGEPFIVDWGGLTANADGGVFEPDDVDQVVISHSILSLADLEHELLDIGFEWDTSWTGTVEGGERLDLSLLSNEAGEAFGGVGDDGVWLLGLYDSDAVLPVPLFLTVLVRGQD